MASPPSGGEDAGEHIDAPGHALDPDAGGASGLGIAADRIERATEAVIAEHDAGDDEGDGGEPDRERQADEASRSSAHRTPPGRSKSVRPLVAPTSMPRRMISMASVTMKALSRRPTTMKPLSEADEPRRPASTTRMPTKVGSSRPKPKLAAGITTIAPIAGAKPKVEFERQVELAGDDDQRLGEHEKGERRGGGQDRGDVRRAQEDRADQRSR